MFPEATAVHDPIVITAPLCFDFPLHRQERSLDFCKVRCEVGANCTLRSLLREMPISFSIIQTEYEENIAWFREPCAVFDPFFTGKYSLKVRLPFANMPR